MKVRMSDVGALPDLEIAVDGLTVITGMNGTGKSTLLKAIYCATQPAYSFEEMKKAEAEDKLRKIIQIARGIGSYRMDDDIERLLAIAKEIPKEDLNQDAAQTLASVELLLEGKSDRKYYEMKVEEAIRIEFGSLSQFIDLRKNREAVVKLSNSFGECSCVVTPSGITWEGDFNRIPDVMYYDTPFVMDPDFSGLKGFRNHRDMLSAYVHYNSSDTIRGMNARDKRKTFDKIMEEVIDGEIVNGAFEYMTSDGIKIDIRNMAAGMKVFAIIRVLVDKGFLGSDSVLLLDEPEVHLHPTWINILAKVIAVLVKDLGVKVVMTTHSPHLLMAVEDSSKSSSIGTRYYDLSKDSDGIVFDETTEDLQPVYGRMADPLIEISSRFLE